MKKSEKDESHGHSRLAILTERVKQVEDGGGSEVSQNISVFVVY